ncbi:MAG TPA: nitroreductase family protein [Bacilli bacterium]|nr:MAG: 5,6-dimethylbenzimidazole synthase [Tenericutes bacterium ADurb.BinA124]HPN60679.1 nitroreductase family protein [Bacilli bacterium]HPX83758.1 nitroreductase family protein [Bacilli bacterium]HQC73939.1 nitroreductase family protein [Bacilli bacterium]
MDIINYRRSVRSFTDQVIEPEKIEQLLRAGMQAPSARNQQPWHFLVVQNREQLLKIYETSPYARMFTEATAAIIVLMDKTNLKNELMAPQDLSAATLNILLRATELGIGSCWCGVFPNSERMASLKVLIKAPDQYEVFSLIALGYPQDADAFRFVDRFDPTKISYEEF